MSREPCPRADRRIARACRSLFSALAFAFLLSGAALCANDAAAQALTAGRSHSCALSAAGGVKCWGAVRALSDSSAKGDLVATDVALLASGVRAVKSGADSGHVCVLTGAGGVKCWGDNTHGQLGDDSTKFRKTAVDVVGLSSGVTALALGSEHTCALLASGAVQCWGRNDTGQLGDGSYIDRHTPVPMLGFGQLARAIEAGANHSCLITLADSVLCWGDNRYAQLGIGVGGSNILAIAQASAVVGLDSDIADLALGAQHSCARSSAGAVKCWGTNDYGQLGDNSTQSRLVPVGVTGLSSGVKAIAAGSYGSCAINASGAVQCWGQKSGEALFVAVTTPQAVAGLDANVERIAGGSFHYCARLIDARIRCWGDDSVGQLGDNVLLLRALPVDVVGLTAGVKGITVGQQHSCAIRNNGSAQCWGANYDMQLGDTTTSERHVPVDVVGAGSNLASLEAGRSVVFAITDAGRSLYWGQLESDDFSTRSNPREISGFSAGIKSIATVTTQTCAVTTAGDVKCFGNFGPLNLSATDAPEYGSGLTAIVPNYFNFHFNFCVLTGAGAVKCRNSGPDATLVPGLEAGVSAITAGVGFACALSGGGVKCWGDNSRGQLGNGRIERDPRSSPVDVVGLSSGVSMISAGPSSACAVTTAGQVKCWGDNSSGQLGGGVSDPRTIATLVPGLDGGIRTVDTGAQHSCAVSEQGGVKCWGQNSRGQLGNGEGARSVAARDVVGSPFTATYTLGGDATGSFYNPTQSGHGWFIEAINTNGTPQLLAAWYTFLNGQPLWLFGTGPIRGNTASIPLFTGSNTNFPPQFDQSQVRVEPWGSVELNFGNSNNFIARWTPTNPAYTAGELGFARLSTVAAADGLSPAQRITACHTGAWYNAAQAGHGFTVEVLGGDTAGQMQAAWYAYKNGQSYWLIGQGPIVGDTATLAMKSVTGGEFPPRFNADNIVVQDWGTLHFRAIDADHAHIDWTVVQPGFTSSDLDLVRLTRTVGRECP